GADLVPDVATHAAVAAGAEAQAGRQVDQFPGDGVADLAARDPPAAGVEAVEQLLTGVLLRAGRVAVRAALASSLRPPGARAAARLQPVVDVDVLRAQRRIHEAGVAERNWRHRAAAVVGDVVGPALAQHVQRRHQVEVAVELAAAAGHELHPPAVDVVGDL